MIPISCGALDGFLWFWGGLERWAWGGLGVGFGRREGPPLRDTKDRVWAMGWAMVLGDGFWGWGFWRVGCRTEFLA